MKNEREREEAIKKYIDSLTPAQQSQIVLHAAARAGKGLGKLSNL